MISPLYIKYKRYIPTGALILGFLVDYLTLTRPDSFWNNAVLIFYFTIAAVGILIWNGRKGKDDSPSVLPILAITQFAFGSLASGILVLYGRSGTLTGNWLFFFLLAVFLIGNEFAKSRYEKTRVHIVAFYILLLSYSALVGPVVFGRMGTLVFLASVLGSLVIMGGYLSLLYLLARKSLFGHWKAIARGVVAVAAGFSLMYAFNLIPPVPLALKDIGIFHSVVRTSGGNYEAVFEAPAWYEFWRSSDKVFHAYGDARAYCWSAVFAPVGLSTPIYHRWELYNREDREWKTKSRVAFPIAGGREEGYRGYTIEDSIEPGDWRCSVETEDGSIIGRTSFRVVSGNTYPALRSGIR
ncbi:MAG: DUF2914 domain-containing protein [Patescibacteria group bacterium]